VPNPSRTSAWPPCETWQRTVFGQSGFATDPTKNTGFSDPDLTQDEGGRVYDTGIDLANDAIVRIG